MTIREFYEYAKSVGAEDDALTIIYRDYDEGDGSVEDIFFTPCETDFANSGDGLVIDAR